MHTNHTTHDDHHRLRRTLAVTLAAGLMLPAAIAVAKPGEQSAARALTRPTASAEAPARGPIARPAAQVDTVYRGALDGALGSHTWSGDLFGTGVITTVTYDVVLDEAGVPLITGVVVDESSLPVGATYELRSSTNRTSGDVEELADDEPKADEAEDESPSEEPAPVEEVIEEVAASDEGTTTTTIVEDTTTTQATETSTVTFASRSGVEFSMEGRWAGLLLLAHGRLGDDPVIAVRTVMVSPPAERPDPVEETTTTSTIAVPTEDTPEKPDRAGDERTERDRDTKGRDQNRDQRGDRGSDDRGRGHDRADHGRDKPPTGS
jgi:hypothetical protein